MQFLFLVKFYPEDVEEELIQVELLLPVALEVVFQCSLFLLQNVAFHKDHYKSLLALK